MVNVLGNRPLAGIIWCRELLGGQTSDQSLYPIRRRGNAPDLGATF
jgi:hypothetical protein